MRLDGEPGSHEFPDLERRRAEGFVEGELRNGRRFAQERIDRVVVFTGGHAEL
ncbi:MAG TPA: hypothetical protein VII82_05935 [Polyangiaceae bacterium]